MHRVRLARPRGVGETGAVPTTTTISPTPPPHQNTTTPPQHHNTTPHFPNAISYRDPAPTHQPLGEEDEFRPAAMAADVVAAAKESGLGEGPFVVVGHSMGGRIAMRLGESWIMSPELAI